MKSDGNTLWGLSCSITHIHANDNYDTLLTISIREVEIHVCDLFMLYNAKYKNAFLIQSLNNH